MLFPPTHRVRAARLGAALALGVVSAAGVAPAGSASAFAGAPGSTCSFDPVAASISVSIGAPNTNVVLSRTGPAITLDGVPCGTATTTNTNSIGVTGSDGQQGVELRLSSGALGPGVNVERKGISEIELAIDLGAGTDDLVVTGGSHDETFRFGPGALGLNADKDVDATLAGIESILANGGGGNDLVSAGGVPEGPGPLVDGAALDGQGGRDTVVGGDGPDTLRGGEGSDLIDAGDGPDTLTGEGGNDQLYGGNDADVISGGDGQDLLDGEDGGDTLVTAAADGGDFMAGGTGVDTADYSSRTQSLTIDLDGLSDDGGVGEHDNVRPDVEIVLGGSSADRITGNDLRNTIVGGPGGDTLAGGSEDDVLNGGADADSIDGAYGDDVLNGGAGGDSIVASNGEDRVDPGTENDSVTAGAGDDTVVADSSPDGADAVTGGAGSDTVSYASRAVAVSITLDGNADDGQAGEGDNVAGDVEILVAGSGGDSITGNAGAQTLRGGAGADTLGGAGGLDHLFGEVGGDTLTGGDGADVMDGGGDNDTMHAVDGGTDAIDCGGGGADTATDVDSIDSLSLCEVV